MGVGTREHSGGNVTFWNVLGCKIYTRVEEGTEGAVARKLSKGVNSGKVVWEKFIDYADGKITAIKTKDGQFGFEIKVVLKDNSGEANQFQFTAKSREGRYLMERLRNINYDLPILMEVWNFPDPNDKEKNVRVFKITQGGEVVKSYYRESTPIEGTDKFNTKLLNGYPDPVSLGLPASERNKADQEMYNMYVDRFLMAATKEFVEQKFGTASETDFTQADKAAGVSTSAQDNSEDNDDLPF